MWQISGEPREGRMGPILAAPPSVAVPGDEQPGAGASLSFVCQGQSGALRRWVKNRTEKLKVCYVF